MKRTNIYLAEDELAALQVLGRRQGRPVAALVREAIDQWLEGQGVRPIDEAEWSQRFVQLLGRRRRLAAEAGWTQEDVDRDVARAVAEVRKARTAARR
jgi:hypothetical protein